MERTDCIICRIDDTEALFDGRDVLQEKGESFPVVRCKQCGLVYANPRPDEDKIMGYYSEHDGIVKTSPALVRLYKLEDWLVRPLQSDGFVSLPRGSRVLDVGCGYGNFLEEQRRRGMEVHGLEPSKPRYLHAREKLGLNVVNTTLAEAGFPPGYFDAIYLVDVVEHLHDPRETLEECYRLLKDHGLLMLSTPDILTVEARISGRFWRGYDIPQHLFFFSGTTLRLLLEKSGFRMTRLRHAFSTRLILSGLWLFLHNKGMNAPGKIFVLSLAYPLALCSALVLSRLGLSGPLRVVAAKHRPGPD